MHSNSRFYIGIRVLQKFNPEGGNWNTQFNTSQTHSVLHQYLKAIKGYKKPTDGYFLRAESFYNLATYMDSTGYLVGYGNKSLHQQSHGESFMATLTNKLRGNGFYMMDEPEAALSPARQLAAIAAIHQLVVKKSQFIIATHSPILLAYPRAKIYHFSENGIYPIKYKDTEHYTITKDFLNRHEMMMEILMDD